MLIACGRYRRAQCTCGAAFGCAARSYPSAMARNRMAIATREFDYEMDGEIFAGALARDDADANKRPAVMVLHGWEGRSEGQMNVARSLAALGYVGVACDLFGKGIRGEVTGDNSALIAPLLQDRAMLRARLLETAKLVRSLPEADPNKLAAIGFCFGGLCVLDLARSGLDLRGVASFHGTLGSPVGLPREPIKAKVIVFHGYDDPMAPPADLMALANELSELGADWQIHAYGATMHAFMAVGANRPEVGIQYNERSARRAWHSLVSFLTEALAD
jgi:dienelactone hydrolase